MSIDKSARAEAEQDKFEIAALAEADRRYNAPRCIEENLAFVTGAQWAYAREDVPALVDEVERLRSALDNSAVSHGIAVAHAGDWKHRAEMAEAERDRLRAAVDAVRTLVEEGLASRSFIAEDGHRSVAIYTNEDARQRIRAALDEHLKED